MKRGVLMSKQNYKCSKCGHTGHNKTSCGKNKISTPVIIEYRKHSTLASAQNQKPTFKWLHPFRSMKEKYEYELSKLSQNNQKQFDDIERFSDRNFEKLRDKREYHEWAITFARKNGRRQRPEELERISKFLLTDEGQKEIEKTLTRPNLKPHVKEKYLQIKKEIQNSPQTFHVGEAIPEGVQPNRFSYPLRADDRNGGHTSVLILLNSIKFHDWLYDNWRKADGENFSELPEETSRYLSTDDGQEDLEMIIARTGVKPKIRKKLLELRKET